MNISAAVAAATESLEQAGVTEYRREASSLLRFVLERPASFLIAHPEYELSETEAVAFAVAVERRTAREPFQYITGRQEFYGLDFVVEREVLIPRPETEVLVEASIKELAPMADPRFCEIGVGSGCISISILHHVPSAVAVGVDLSLGALAVARRNSAAHAVGDRLSLMQSDLLAAVEGEFDLIVSNPPYIPDVQIGELQPEVRDFEPRLALSGGESGIDTIRRIVADSPRLLTAGGWLLLEIGFDQSDIVSSLFDRSVWSPVEFLPDFQGIQRVAVARLS